jgi:hypothetical protein
MKDDFVENEIIFKIMAEKLSLVKDSKSYRRSNLTLYVVSVQITLARFLSRNSLLSLQI